MLTEKKCDNQIVIKPKRMYIIIQKKKIRFFYASFINTHKKRLDYNVRGISVSRTSLWVYIIINQLVYVDHANTPLESGHPGR